MTGSPGRLRTQVRAALAAANISQAEACRRLGVSTKHLSMMLTGRSVLTLDFADRLLGLCEMTLLIGIDCEGKAKVERHTVDTITSDALDALYEQLEAAQQTELARQLATCDKAFASATLRAARAEAAIERVRQLATRLEEFAENALKTDDRQLYAALAADLRTAIDEQQPTTTTCTCHNSDERCSGCGACPDTCNGCR